MKIKIMKEKDLGVNVEAVCEILNRVAKSIVFDYLDVDVILKDTQLSKKTSLEDLSTQLEALTKKSDIVIFISKKQYDDNYFFHSNDKYYLLSLYGREYLTTYGVNTLSFFFILDMLALEVDDSFRHREDGEKECIYCFRENKTDVHHSIQSSIICDKCQERILGLGDNQELITNDIVDLLDVLKKSNVSSDIVEYWVNNNKLKEKEQVKIFFSYAHRDRNFLEEFKEYIKIFERNGLVERWDDNELIVGEKWDNTIKERIYSADIIIFLLSSTSLASDYIYDNELKIAFELNQMDEAYVVPIIIKDCLWDMTEFQEFQTLPLDGKAVNSWSKKEEAWTSVARGLKKAIDNIITAKQSSIKGLDSQSVSKIESLNKNADVVLKFLQVYSRWWFNIPRIINWGAERDGFSKLRSIEYSEMEEILKGLKKTEAIQTKKSVKNKEKLLYKISV